MKNFNQFLIILILSSSTTIAEESFIDRHKINKSHIKSVTKGKAKAGDKNSYYIKINNKEEFKKAYKEGKLNPILNGKGDKHIVMEIRGVHLSKNDLKEIETLNIKSEIKNSRRVKQIIKINNSKFNTDTHIELGTRVSNNKINSITNVIDITNTQLGKR